MKTLKLSLIRSDAGTQSRVAISEEVVADYADRYKAGDKFPPVIVFRDGTDYFLADGFHRVLSRVRSGAKDIACDVRKGTRLDALKYSLGANQANGLRRTNADKRHCVELALIEFPKLSDRSISEMCGVNHHLVADCRPAKQVGESPNSTHTGKDGKEYPATKKSAPDPDPEPEERPQVVAGPAQPSAPAGNLSPLPIPEADPEKTEAVASLLWWWKKAKRWEKEEFCELVNLKQV